MRPATVARVDLTAGASAGAVEVVLPGGWVVRVHALGDELRACVPHEVSFSCAQARGSDGVVHSVVRVARKQGRP